LLQELSAIDNVVIATGGGIVLEPANRTLLHEGGLVVWLQASVEQQLRRLANDKQRPLLQADDRRAKLENLARERDPLYRQVADLEFVSGKRSVAHMARELTRALLDMRTSGNDSQHNAHD
jgi:shikimate kinase